MLPGTAKAASSATATTGTMEMMLPPPSIPASRRVTTLTSASQLVPSLLSELAFSNETPHPHLNMIVGMQKERRGNGENRSRETKNDHLGESSNKSLLSSWRWNGLLCFSLDDPDMFFDAEEKLLLANEDGMDSDGKIIDAMTLVTLSESSDASAESRESVEVKLDNGAPDVTMACELRGGQQRDAPQHLRRDVAAFDQHPPAIDPKNPFARLYAPPPPKELPLRFLRAGKGDPIEGQRRYEATLQWRKENGMDNILFEAHPLFEMVKHHYPHYYHLRGKQNEPVFYEQPPKTDLEAMRRGGMDLHGLVRHYAMVTEFQWQFIEKNDFARGITVLDLDGMRMMDFAGEVIEYVKMCSTFTGQHYPERAGHVIVVNVPRWFAMIWKVVKPMVDEVTLKKISIVRGREAVFAALAEKIPVENIPPEYGGQSMPLGESPEEHALRDLIRHNNALANGDFSCGGKAANPPCRFCSWGPVRSY